MRANPTSSPVLGRPASTHVIRTALLLLALVSFAALFSGCATTAGGGSGAEAPAPVIEGEWVVTEIDGKRLVAGTEAVLAFGPDGAFSGDSGVNRLRASYGLEGGRLQLTEVMATRMAGPPELMDQESRLLAALRQARAVQVSGEQLSLVDGEGVVLVVASAR